jgi:hypothetical protein
MILDHITARNKKAAENNGSNDLLRPDPTRQAASNQPWTNAQERSHLPGSRMARRVEHGAIDRQSGDGVADGPEDARIIGDRARP